VEEACSIAALTGHAISHVRLTAPDVDRPFAILRELGPTLLELPGALGAAPETLAAVRGLCGRGPAQYVRRPANAYDSRAVAADIQRKVVDLVNAVTDEQPLVIRIENADHIDEASLELVEALVSNGKRLCMFMATRVPLTLSDDVSLGLAVCRLRLAPLGVKESHALLLDLFNQSGREPSTLFLDNAVKVSAGIPLFLQLLFKNFLVTEDPTGLPSTLADSLTASLDRLKEPAKGVLDAVVILGGLSTVNRIGRLIELPTYSLVQAFRTLEEQGFIRFTEGAVLASHDMLADAARRRMPPSVSQLLHGTAAGILESEKEPESDPLEIAIHWQASGENTRALEVLINSARRSITLGRPRQAMALLQRASGWPTSIYHRLAIDTALLEACHAAGEDHLGLAAAERIDGLSNDVAPDVRVMGIEMAVGAGRELTPYRNTLELIAADRSLESQIRCRAARLLVMIADDLGDVTIGNSALGSIADTDSRTTERAIPRLIFEVVFGSTQEAIKLAGWLAAEGKSQAPKGIGIQAMWTASAALWRCGEASRSVELATEAFEIARANSVWSACTTFASLISDIAWENGDLVKCQEWFDLSAEMIKRSGGPDRGYHHFGVAIVIALENNDPQQAWRLLEEAEKLYPGTLRLRLGVSFLAHRILVKLALNATPSEQEVEELVKGHCERRALGAQDIVAHATVGALRRLGRFDEARQVREDYLQRYRKERTPVSSKYTHLSA
jgi:hypothetical protein